MRQFFKGWRRKAGCVTLLMACVCAAGWVRSYSTFDFFGTRPHNSFVCLMSNNGAVLFFIQKNFRFDDLSKWEYPQWRSEESQTLDAELMDIVKWQSVGFAYGEGNGSEAPLMWVAPYWSIVVPLTVLSAWLLFMPRKKPGQSTHSK